MKTQVVVDLPEYQALLKELEYYKNERYLSITIKGDSGAWEFLGYNESKYQFIINAGTEVPIKLTESIDRYIANELNKINTKIKEFTLLKGEIEVIQNLNQAK